jgi:tetratricopeptide (TPR) repeat protein
LSNFVKGASALALLGVSLLNGQFNAEFGGSSQSRIRGQVQGPDYGPLLVELYDGDRHNLLERSLVSPNGSFEFNQVVKSAIEVRVISSTGDVLRTEYVSAMQTGLPLIVNLPTGPKRRPVSGFSTPYSLSHKVPSKAQSEYVKAEKATRKKDLAKAVQHLRKALVIDPGFVEAHNNLAVRLVESGSMEDAVPVLQRASELDPNNPTVKANLRRVLEVLRVRQAKRQ